MMNETGPFEPCPACGADYPTDALSCPQCHALRHAETLKRLHLDAQRFAEAGDHTGQRDTLERMLVLLPHGTRQRTQLEQRLERLREPKRTGLGKWGALAGVALLLWKFKWVLGFLLTKGKMLLLGLTKVKTLFSMVFALGAYWAVWGWQFALGFVLSIYVHEMGHVIALRKLGIRASAPMFIPFVGAFVRLKDYPKTPSEDAEVGLAGPIYGLAAALGCYALYWATDIAVLRGIAHAGAWINLFNLIPVWQLDGGRGFNALDRRQRWIATGIVALGWFVSGDAVFILVLLGAGYRVLMTPAPEQADRRALVTYGALIAVIALLARIEVPELGSDAPAVSSVTSR